MTHVMGEHGRDQFDDFFEHLRRTLTQPPEEHVANRHLHAMSQAARGETGDLTWWERRRRSAVAGRISMRNLTPRWMAAGLAGLLGLMGGLASAGTLPDVAQHLVAQTISHVGLNVPDPNEHADVQDQNVENDQKTTETEDTEVTTESTGPKAGTHGAAVNQAIQDARDQNLEGCDFGQAVRAVASSKNHASDTGTTQSTANDPCANQGEQNTTESTENETDSTVEGQSQGANHSHASDTPAESHLDTNGGSGD